MGKFLNYEEVFPDAESDEAVVVWREDGTGKSVQKLRDVQPRNGKPLLKVSMSEVSKHNTEDDLWIVVDNKVYDCTKYLRKHPGGILPLVNMAGKDCSDPFISYHPSHVFEKWLPGMLVAELEITECDHETRTAQIPTLQAFRKLRQQFLKDGMFETDYWFYANKAMQQSALLSVAVFLTVFCSSYTAHIIGAILLGCFWQQLAFIGHDTGHNAITHRQDWDSYIGIVVGNLLGGISMAWWKRSHNVHHIVTNSMEHDPDIQHMPVFACNEKIVQKGNYFSSYHQRWFTVDAVSRVLVRHQHLLLYVIMAVARFNLYIQSWILVIKSPKEVRLWTLEVGGMVGFWLWLGMMLSSLPTASEVVQYLLVSHGIAGILHIQIIVSHFPMTVYNDRPYQKNDDQDGWLRLQLETTQDILCSPYMDWFHGGLQFQVCHHLFPRIPRHNLRKVHEALLIFCKEHNLNYHMATFYEANKMTLQKMQEAATCMQKQPGAIASAAWKDCMLRDVLYAEG